ncbi:MAG: PilZ domain-containing protein [Deltaproteobacteria bacterium]|nr:PilZ domain-containing protein [Deltaproteobacteria bacterium]
MSDPISENRREHPRWRLERELFCYVDGRRLDARCENISEGGLFVRTRDRLALPLGATVGLVFRREAGYGHPIFLFGRVMRRQAGATPGVGLEWEKAVTDGSSEQLTDFMKTLFRLPFIDIAEESGGPPGAERYVYRFSTRSTDPVLPLKYQKPSGPDQMVNRLDDAEPMPRSRMAGDTLEVPAHVFTGEELPHSSESGAISRMIQRKKSLSPVSLYADLTADNMDGKGRVVRLGLDGLIIRTSDFSMDSSTYLSARIGIPCETGYRNIVCKCLVEKATDGLKANERVMDLKITEVDECGSPGVLARYVKWLHFHSLART